MKSSCRRPQTNRPEASDTVGFLVEINRVVREHVAYVIRDDMSNLADVCDDLLGADPLASVRSETKIYYLGDFPDENYADGFLAAARNVIDAGRRTPAALL